MELIQSETQEQKLEQKQKLRIKAQQVLVARMLEKPLPQMEQDIQTEMYDNPALEGEKSDHDEDMTPAADYDTLGDETEKKGRSFEEEEETEERKTELDKALDSIDNEDRLPQFNYSRSKNHDPDADQEEKVFGKTASFYDDLNDQMRELMLTEREETVMEYLIGSLDSDGLLRKGVTDICDEIAIKEYIEVTEEEVERCITKLQSFDPAGIGARSLQECLLIQIFRKKPSHITKLMYNVVNDCYDDFIHKKWKRVASRLNMDEGTAEEVFAEIGKLNPRPGAPLGETMGKNTQQVTPDFIIDVDDYDNISFTINRGNVPDLYVSPDFQEMIDGYRKNPKSMTRSDKEALLYAQQKVTRAQSYIEAIRQRQKTMTAVMNAIITMQRTYILTGDEEDLKPMILDDVAKRAGVDISTVSRVCNSKYAQTPQGIIPMNAFFSDGYDIGNGEMVSTRVIKNALRELIDREDKNKPLSDEALAKEMAKGGYPIARRTVAKYREQLGIPSSSLRKQLG